MPIEACALEERILFSASPLGFLGDPDVAPNESIDLGAIDDLISLVNLEDLETSPNTTEYDFEAELLNQIDLVSVDDVRHELLVIDSAVPDFEVLLEHLTSQLDSAKNVDTEVLILDAETDGIQAITKALLADSDWDAVHIVSHGAAGEVQLGSDVLSSESPFNYADQLTSWRDALSADADLIIYGCDVAADDAGRVLLENLSDLTGADIAASDDRTGHADLGGDWEFEYLIGDVALDLAFTADVQANWIYTLDITTGLVGHFEFDEGSGTAVVDSSVTGNDGTLLNSPTWSTERAVGTRSLDLGSDGAGLNAYAEIPDDPAYSFGSGDFTIAFWYNSTVASAGNSRLVGVDDGFDAISVFADSFGDMNFIAIGDTTAMATVSGGYITDGNWHHVAATRVGDTFSVYVDQTSFSTSTAPGIGNLDPITPITIGAGSSTITDYDGLLDDVRIYQRALSSTDIGELMDQAGQTIVVDTVADYIATDLNFGNTSDISSLLLDKGADGLISLREAITAANNTMGYDRIVFNIAGGGPHTIDVVSQLQINDAVFIDGMSESDATLGGDGIARPVIELNGGGLGIDGIELITGSGGSRIEGLIINNFGGSGLEIHTSNNTIVGNFIGTDATGTLDEGNAGSGILIVSGNDNVIGGTSAADTNVISGNSGDGIQLFGNTTYLTDVLGNYIGADVNGNALGNNGNGINVRFNSNANQIGGTALGAGNLIIGNQGDGVSIDSTALSTQILGNSIYANVEQAIDLNDDGPTANDPGDADSGGNHLQNYPTVTNVNVIGSSISIDYDTSDFEAGTYTVQFFASSADGQAERHLQTVAVVAPGSGLSTTFIGSLTSGEFVTAIATEEISGNPVGDSSEVSAGFLYGGNVAPVLDLDADDSSGGLGLNYETVFTPGGGPVYITDIDTLATDSDHTTFSSVVVTITNLLDGTDESLSVTLPSGAWSQFYNPTTGELSIVPGVGSTHADWESVLETITYDNASATPTTTNRIISVLVSDGVDDNSVLVAEAHIAFGSAVNDAPYFVSTPSAQGDTVDPSASGASRTTAADIDGDGDLDLVATLATTGDVVWYENDGTGTFGAATNIASGFVEPQDVVSSDIDGDGDMDLIIADYSIASSTVTILSNDGSGGFTPTTIDAVSQGTVQVEAGDIDGDGDMDIAAAFWFTSEIVWYENLGGGTWGKATVGTAPGATSVDLADVDSDGNLDIVSTHRNTSEIVWYENNGGTPATFTSHSLPLLEAFDIEAVDLDGDGDVDFGYVGLQGEVGWYENDGAIAPSFTDHLLGIYGAPRQISSADLDGDGLAELMVSLEDDNTFLVLENEGGGQFAETRFATGSTPSSIQAADLDGDSDLDVFTSDRGTSDVIVHENYGGGGFAIATTNEDTSVAVGGISIGDLDAGGSPLEVTIGVTNGSIDLAGVSGLTFSNGDGTDDTAMTFTGSLVNINAAIATITYNPDQDFVGQGQFQVVVDDLGNTGSGGPLSVARTFVVDVLPINDAPTINGLDANQSYIDGGPPVPIDTNVTITDQELSAFDNFGGATLYIGRTGGANPEDIFSATGLLGTLVEGGNLFYNSTVVGSVNLNSGGELVLEFNSLATNTVVNSIAQSIAYSNSSATPPANVDLLWNFNDVNSSGLQGSGGAQFTSAQILVTIDTNTAPLLDNSAGMSLTPLVEGQTNPSGDSVANIIASAGGDRITDVDPGAVEGIAVIIVDNVDGDWQYSLDGGSNWLSFGVVGGSSATLLDTTAMVRFVPDVDYTGSTFFSFRAWDQSDGNISGQSGIDIASTGGTSAFSLDTQSATINISPVNDAPILDTTGNLTLTNVAQDDSNPSGDTIAAIVASDGGDRVTDVDTGAVEGIALTFVETTFGFWEYKANSATAWTAVPTVSDSNALLLAPDSELRFVPNSGYNGTSTLSFRAWDQTSGSVGLLRDASLNGGSTAFSVASEGASVTVAPNSAPVLDLDLDNSSGAPGNQNFTSFSTGNGPVNIADTDATLTDIDSPTLSSLTVVLVNPLDGSLEVLSANAGGNPNLSVNYSTSTGILSIVGTDTVATYEQVLRTITYENTSSSPDTTTRTLNVVASDGANNSLIAQSLVSIVSDITAPSVVTNTGNSVLEGNADVIQATELNFSDDIHPTSSLTYTITNAPTNGFVALLSNPNTPITTFSQTQIDAGNLVYVHDDSETTFDSFSFVVDDGVGNSTTTQSFSISVTPVNDAPVGVDDNYTVNEGASIGRSAAIGLLSNDSDAEGDAIFASLLTQATNGTATLAADGSFVYIHDGSETTSDSFTYTTSDANGATSTATVNILIAPVNDAPILAIDDATLNFTEQSPIGVDVSAVVTDIDSPNLSSATIQISANYEAGFDQIVFTDTSNISGIWDSVTGTLTLSGTDTVANYQTALQTLQFQNASDNPSSATRTVTLSVTDEGGLVSASDARDIAIFQTNDAPVAVSDTYNTPEDTALVIPATGVLSNDTDLDGDALTVASVVNAATNGNVSLNADGSFTYTPNLNFTGSDSFAYEITDGNGGTAQATVNITVGGINDPPAAVNDAFTTNEDTSYTATLGVSDLLLNDSDLDGDTLSVNTTPVTGPGNGTLTLNTNGTFTYTPNNNFNGVDSFVYEVFDGNGGTAQATVAITVIAQNDAPIAVNNGLSLSEDAEITTLLSNLLLNDSDPDGDVLTVSPIPVTAPTNGILTFNGDGTYTYTPNADFNGSDSFVYEISDGNGGVAQATVGISVTPKNDAPFATNDMFSTNEDTPYSAILGVNDLLLNDTDVDGDLLAVNATPVIGPANGVVTINTDGTFTYTPNTGFTGTDSFVYEASDGNGGTAQATVSITVAGTDEPPVAVNDAFTTNEDSPFTTTLGVNDLLLNDAGGTLSVNPSPIAAPTNGSLVLNSDGTFTYVPDQDFNGLDSFIYEVMDTNGGTAQATVNITVTAVNDSPLANNESYNVDEGETLSTSLGVLLNDSDVDGDPLTAAIISGPTNGSLTLNPDGSFSYSHDGSETTGDSFTYQVDDPSGATSIATATIAIAPVNDAPTASSPGTVVTNQNTPIALSTINGTAFSVGDIDAQGNPIIVTLSTSNGTLSLASTGGLTFAVGNGSNSSTLTFIGTIDDIQNALDGLQFSPDESFVGNTNISLTVDDQGNFGSGGAKNANAQVLIQVTANESPVSQSDTFSAPIGTAQDGNVLANDTDPDSPNLTATLVEAPTNGTLGLLPDGSFSYLSNPGFVGTDSFTYMASDGFSMSDVATVEINVTPIGNTTPETTSSTTDNSDDSAGNDPPTLTDTTTDQEDDANEIVVPNETVATLATTNPIDSIPTQIVQRVTQTEPEDTSTKLPILVSRVPLDAGPSIIDTIVARSLEGSFDRSEVTVDSNISFDSFPDLLAVSSLRPSAWLWTKMSDVSEQLNEDSRTFALGASMMTVTATAMSVGYVLWSIRSSYLVASMLSAIPAWKRIDPLPILSITAANRSQRLRNAAQRRGETLLDSIKNEEVNSIRSKTNN